MDDTKNSLNENVRICIQSRQIFPGAETDQMETVIFGRHYYREGKQYLLYDELLEGVDSPTSCRIKLYDNKMEMTRQGDVRTILTFEKGQRHKSNYHTPYGVISLETETTHFHIDEQTNSLEVETKYTLVMDGQPVSENHLRIGVYNC